MSIVRRGAEWLGLVEIPEVLERTNDNGWSDAWEASIGDFWAGLSGSSGASNQRLIEQVWVANRCLQMNANAISSMPLQHFGNRKPAWVANPDPVWFPNGIGDCVFAIVWSLYGWGDAFVYVTSRYTDGFPQAWTVLDAEHVTVQSRNGKRQYRIRDTQLDARDMVQITRDPRGGLRGTSAIASYSAYTNGLLAAADLGRVMMGTGVPTAVLKSNRKLDQAQAEALQTQWVTATAARRGAPAVLPPEIDFERLAFSPADLLLMDVQKFNAQVIASAYGVPATFLNMSIEGGLNYTTPVLGLEQWWRTELLPTAERVAEALSSQMLPAGAYVEFDAREFLAPTFKELAESWTLMFEKGLVSREEYRAAVLGLPPGQTEEEALAELTETPSAGASPSQQPTEVIPLRPTQVVN